MGGDDSEGWSSRDYKNGIEGAERGGTGRRWLGQIGSGLRGERGVKKMVKMGIAVKERLMIRKGW